MINRVVIVGRLTKDPSLTYTPNGIPVSRFIVAVNRTFSNQQGDREADFVNCIAWRKQAENLANYMKKGSLIGVEGRIQTGSFEGQDGKRVYTTDVVADSIQFLESKRDNQYAPPSPEPQYLQQQNQYSQQNHYYQQPSYNNYQNDGTKLPYDPNNPPF